MSSLRKCIVPIPRITEYNYSLFKWYKYANQYGWLFVFCRLLIGKENFMQKEKIDLPVLLRLCLVFIFVNGQVMAQDMPPFKKGTDTAAINQLMRSAAFLPDPDSAIKICKQAAEKSIAANYNAGAAESLFRIATRFRDIGNYPEALINGKQALGYAIKSGNQSKVAFCHNLFGTLSIIQGDYVSASCEFFKALDGLKNIDKTNVEAVIDIYVNLGNVSHLIGQKEKTLYYLNKAEALARSGIVAPDRTILYLCDAIINKGNYYYENKMFDSAVRYYKEVLDSARKLGPGKENARVYFQANSDINMGAIYQQKGDLEKSISYCREAILFSKNRNSMVFADASYGLGNDLRLLKRYKEAEAVLLSELKGNASGHAKSQAVWGYLYLSEVYKDSKQYKKALDCMDTIVAIKDTLVTIEKAKAISQIESKYNMAEKDAQITKNDLLIAQQKNKITQKNIWIGSISAGVLLLFALAIGLDRNNRHKQKEEVRALKQANTISILKGVVQGEENERIRLARDLHDGIGGMLSATKMRFMALRHDNADLTGSPKYLEAMGLLDIMGDEIRKTSHNLMPEVLLKQNLAEALRTYCNNIQAGSDLQIDFQSFGNFDYLSNDFKLNIYRIVQELLKNTLQHAKATYAVVQLMMLEAYLTVSVEDNGTGFDENKTKDGIGLHNLKTRVLSHEGHYTLKSEPGKGTTVYIEFGMPTAEPLKGENQFS